jgi:hypothetical protein
MLIFSCCGFDFSRTALVSRRSPDPQLTGTRALLFLRLEPLTFRGWELAAHFEQPITEAQDFR